MIGCYWIVLEANAIVFLDKADVAECPFLTQSGYSTAKFWSTVCNL